MGRWDKELLGKIQNMRENKHFHEDEEQMEWLSMSPQKLSCY